MSGDPGPVKDLLKVSRRDRKRIDKSDSWKNTSVLINQIKATGRLIETIEKLDKQNRRLEKAALFVGCAGVLAVTFQISSLILPKINAILFSLVSTLFVVLFIGRWIKKGL
ncbi:hypothetical protein KKE78_04890 [Patescibacteria group bacterium]|nr:hypothetical protein [Patescibacteria group bacterium]